MSVLPKEYGEKYKDHLLEQYKLYVEMADRISSRRQSANSFFLTINTAIVSWQSYVGLRSIETNNLGLVSLAGMILCYIWYRLIRSYKDLNSAKFKVIHEIEKELPFALYDVEWDKVGRGDNPKIYLPFTHIEIRVPWIFFMVHLLVFVSCVVFPIVLLLKGVLCHA